MSLFKFFSCCLPSRQSKRTPVLDLPIAAVSPKNTPILDSPIVLAPPTPKIHHVFLLDMPDLVMREILKNLDFLTIQQLRKTCYSLREFIDYVKIDSGLKNFKIEMTKDTIFGSATVNMKGDPSTKFIKSNYTDNEDSCEVKTRGRNIIINGNFVDVFSEDFLIPMLKNQRSVLEKLVLERCYTASNKDLSVEIAEKVFDCLMKVLKSRDRLLQVEDLNIYVFGQDQLMQLLHHIDLKSLKRLEVWQLVEIPTHRENNVKLMLDLSLLECAENLKELSVCNFTISSPLRSIAHVPELHVHMHTIYCDEVLKFHEVSQSSRISPTRFHNILLQTLRTTNFMCRSYIHHNHFPTSFVSYTHSNQQGMKLYFMIRYHQKFGCGTIILPYFTLKTINEVISFILVPSNDFYGTFL
ncbi:hypothetical protein CRE_23320 [Caenorhabditis remanei]|uniref:F-box domain-containing protein n=1 Tax=Caenorhabditis remanei TaxID=31234 RepID=E3MGU2_CAERE|nr:hypothetical protein CRE_23320 [Caenorhabditis remanei]